MFLILYRLSPKEASVQRAKVGGYAVEGSKQVELLEAGTCLNEHRLNSCTLFNCSNVMSMMEFLRRVPERYLSLSQWLKNYLKGAIYILMTISQWEQISATNGHFP